MWVAGCRRRVIRPILTGRVFVYFRRAVHVDAIAISLGSIAWRPGGAVDPAGIVLQIEPGRSLFADAGVHVSRVAHVKTQGRPVASTWVEVDTTGDVHAGPV